MTDTQDRKLRWGYTHAVPEDTKAAWGARLLLTRDGGDLLGDRQDGWSVDEASAKLLHDRLNLIRPWQQPLGLLVSTGTVRSTEANEVVVFEDDLIKVVGNSNGSHGYFYIAGWLK